MDKKISPEKKKVCDRIMKRSPQWIRDGREVNYFWNEFVSDKILPEIKVSKNVRKKMKGEIK